MKQKEMSKEEIVNTITEVLKRKMEMNEAGMRRFLSRFDALESKLDKIIQNSPRTDEMDEWEKNMSTYTLMYRIVLKFFYLDYFMNIADGATFSRYKEHQLEFTSEIINETHKEYADILREEGHKVIE